MQTRIAVAKVGNGRLVLTARERRAIEELVEDLARRLHERADVVLLDLELEVGRRPARERQ